MKKNSKSVRSSRFSGRVVLCLVMAAILCLSLTGCMGGFPRSCVPEALMSLLSRNSDDDEDGKHGSDEDTFDDEDDEDEGDDEDLDGDYEEPEIYEISGDEEDKVVEALEAFLDAYQRRDGEKTAAMLLGSNADEPVSFNGAQGIIAESLNFQFGDAYTYGKGYFVEVTLKALDFGVIYESVIDDLEGKDVSGEEIQEAFMAALERSDAPTRSFEIKVYLENESMVDLESGEISKELKVEMTSDLSNALLGGAMEYLMNVVNSQYQN